MISQKNGYHAGVLETLKKKKKKIRNVIQDKKTGIIYSLRHIFFNLSLPLLGPLFDIK